MRRWITPASVVVVLLMVLAACGGDSGDGGNDTEAPAAAAPADYVAGLCTAITDYEADLEAQNSSFQEQFSSGTPSPGEAKDAIVAFLDEIRQRTRQLIDDVEALGTPDVDNGGEVRSALVGTFQQVVDLFDQAKADIEALPTDDPAAMAAGFAEIGTKLQQAGTEIQSSLDGFESPELDEAAAEATACDGVI
ncbi:MAG TPA: hypothetical protein VG993_01870 [Actinomycetota bacterium]|jgi:hypothetical protein|nr:hypothetical protein [Actinomycetota bacterium]